MGDQALALLKIFLEQFQEHLVQQALIHKLPPPKPLPETWDELLKEDT